MKKDPNRGNKHPLFPDYDFITSFVGNQKLIELKTTIRKQDLNGIWYFWDVVSGRYLDFGYSPEFYQSEILKETRVFIYDCYRVIQLGVVSETIVDSDGSLFFKRDPNQESEQERLSKL